MARVCKECGTDCFEKFFCKGLCKQCYVRQYMRARRANPKYAAKEKAYNHMYWAVNRDKAKERSRLNNAARRQEWLKLLGGCSCCGMQEEAFLSVVTSDKLALPQIYHKAPVSTVGKLEYKVLCQNCLHVIRKTGKCPHH